MAENNVTVGNRADHVRILTLNNGEHQDGIQYRVKKGLYNYKFWKTEANKTDNNNNNNNNNGFSGWQIEFRLGPSLFGKVIDVFTNHPPNIGEKFERQTYYQLKWTNDVASIRINSAGSFHYYVTDAKYFKNTLLKINSLIKMIN